MLAKYHGKDAAVIPDFTFRSGFLYTQVRAISARINQNFDGWPSAELKKSYKTFLNRPVFVNHQNHDPTKARGKVVAARYVEAGDDKYIEVVQEIDAARFPKLAREIKEGGLDSVSMGVEAGFTICSYCGNKAVDVPDFCSHVKYHKGSTLPRRNDKTGATENVLVYEKCFRLGFFELSYVFDPADETAVVSRVIAAGKHEAAPEAGVQVSLTRGSSEGRWNIHRPGCAALNRGKKDREVGGHDELNRYPDRKSIVMDIYPPSRFDYDPDHPKYGWKYYGKNIRLHDCMKGELPEDAGVKTGAASPALPPDEIVVPDLPTGQMPEASRRQGWGNPMNEKISSPRRGRDYRHLENFPPPPPKKPGLMDRLLDYEDKFLDELANDRKIRELKEQYKKYPELRPTARRRWAYGEIEAPEDIDTLRDDEPDDDDFKHYVESPRELRGPDFDRTKRLDRDQEAEGLDTDRRVEDVEDVSGPPQGGRMSRRRKRRPILVDVRTGRRYYADDAPPPDPSGPPGDDDSGPAQSDEDLIQEAEEDLEKADSQGAGKDPNNDDDDDSDHGDDDDSDDDDDDDSDSDADDDSDDDSDDLPPWLKGDDDSGPGNRKGNYISSTQKKRRKGAQMSLSQRRRVAAAGQRRHYAEDGHTDGGPYGENNQGEQEDVFLSQTPSPEAVSAPVPGDGTISNTPNNLVARNLQRRIQQRNAEQRRDLVAWEQITGRRVRADAVVTPDQVDPTVADPAGEALTGTDFQSLGEAPVETQPKDASVRAFRAFDNWLSQTTGRTARQHGNANFIRRSAARYCTASGMSVDSLFPALGNVLREARSNEGRTAMNRYADEKLDVAAPQDRIDVEKPVSGDTSAEAQASQFDTGDFGSNAGDNIADPELSVDSQIWAPGEGSTKSSNRKADGITAVRYAEAYIRAGLAPDTPAEKWKIAGLAQTMRHGTIVDRIRLLDAVNEQRVASARRTAGISRGGGSSIPRGLGQRQLSAGIAYTAANDQSTDSALFFKG